MFWHNRTKMSIFSRRKKTLWLSGILNGRRRVEQKFLLALQKKKVVESKAKEI